MAPPQKPKNATTSRPKIVVYRSEANLSNEAIAILVLIFVVLLVALIFLFVAFIRKPRKRQVYGPVRAKPVAIGCETKEVGSMIKVDKKVAEGSEERDTSIVVVASIRSDQSHSQSQMARKSTSEHKQDGKRTITYCRWYTNTCIVIIIVMCKTCSFRNENK